MAVGYDPDNPQQTLPEGFYGNIKDPNRFHRFVRMDDGHGQWFDFKCGEGLVFDAQYLVCNWPEQADTSYLGNPG